MQKIATHDSATGEKSFWFTIPLIPFARTQSKTIRQQYDAGCRLFDLRIKKLNNTWRMAHGWWFTNKTAETILQEINNFKEPCSVTITYEGKYKANKINDFINFVKYIKQKYNNIKYGETSVKYGQDTKGLKVKYQTVIPADEYWIDKPCISKFLPLNGKTWHTIIPIPYIWKLIYYNKPTFSENYYTYVDFL